MTRDDRLGAAGGDLPVLDGLRALAILLVLGRHGSRALGIDTVPLLENGWVGVDLFFVLSGFLIARQLLAGTPVGPFLLRRALRIVPAFYAVLLLVAARAFPGYKVAQPELGWRVAYHLLFLQDYLPADLVVAFWSLGVEAKFYLLAPLLIALLLRLPSRRSRLLALAGLALLAPASRATMVLVDGLPADYPTHFAAFRSPLHVCLEPLLVGVAIALLHAGGSFARPWRGAAPLLALSALALALALATTPLLAAPGWFVVVGQPVLLALGCGAVVAAALLGVQGSGWLGHAAWRPFARLSYAAYLLHLPLLPVGLGMTVLLAGAPAPLLFLPLWAALSFAAALVLHRLVEQPCLRVGRWLVPGGRAVTANGPRLAG
jgi:peptidoglycan/LPS O-acetylase OafA/YrhL